MLGHLVDEVQLPAAATAAVAAAGHWHPTSNLLLVLYAISVEPREARAERRRRRHLSIIHLCSPEEKLCNNRIQRSLEQRKKPHELLAQHPLFYPRAYLPGWRR